MAKSTVTDEIAWLTRQQCANGLWTSYRSNTSVACPKADPITFVGPDTNSTGMAADGLAAYGNQPRKSLLLNAFKQIQTSDGGFPFVAAPGQTSDPNSTALSIQGLLSYGAKPALARLPCQRQHGVRRAGQLPARLRGPAGRPGRVLLPR